MTVREILSETEYTYIAGNMDREVHECCLDNRKVKKDDAFVAVIGQKGDGHRYIEGAIENGASLIVIEEQRRAEYEEKLQALVGTDGPAVVAVNGSRRVAAEMAGRYFRHPAETMHIFGMTGTKGKTTSTYILHEILERSGRSCGLIGTVENKIGAKSEKAKHTTPEAWQFQSLLRQMKDEDVSDCVMEVSSLGLKFYRTYGVRFEVGVFTNFLNDHVSDGEHETEEDYFRSKLMLFDHCRIALVNKNTRRLDEVLAYAQEHTEKCYTYSMNGDADFYVRDMVSTKKDGVPGMQFTFVCPGYEEQMFVPLLCDFNVDNALCAAATAYLAGVGKEDIRNGMTFVSVPGRMEKIDNELGIRVYVDYAHNGDSLKVLLRAIRPSCEGRIITVFGCGGDRPHDRRYTMGEVSARYSDYTVVTTDNSRTESFEQISGMIVEGIKRVPGAPYCIIEDRKEAIAKACDMATEEDIVVIAGKGHETTMTIGTNIIEFVDSVVTAEVLREIEKERKEKQAKFTLEEILKATGGELKQWNGQNGAEDPASYVVSGVSTDSKKIKNGNLFIALIGERFDGNTFAAGAAKAGAAALILSTMEYAPEDVPVILVPDTKIALEKLAEYYRLRLGCRVIAVTGSVGKTSTRQMITSALSEGCKVHVTKHNNNNEIGLSKTILAAPEDVDVIVLEMGMRLRGEISELTNIAHPDVAVITNIGVAHIERLHTQHEILLAKLEILEGLPEGGLLILPYADKMLQDAVSEGLIRKDVRIAYTSTEEVVFPDYAVGTAVAVNIRSEQEKLFFRIRAGFGQAVESDVCVNAIGLHHASNALAGFLCGLYMEIDTEIIAAGITSFYQIGHRERQVNIEGVHFLDDSYNAGPESMMSAFASIRRMAKDGKAYACVGDMLELGNVSEEKHFEIGERAAKEKLDGLLVLGQYKEQVLRGVRSVSEDMPVFLFQNKKEMTEKLSKLVKPGDYVLLKASHSFEMYTILDEYGSIVRGGCEQ